MFESITFARYSMTVDVYELDVAQDPNSMRVVKDWKYAYTVPCYAQSIESTSASDISAGKRFRREYKEHERITLKVEKEISGRCRLTNFRNQENVQMWLETEQIGQEPTMFMIDGSNPRYDPFGNVVEYEILAMRVDVQDVR